MMSNPESPFRSPRFNFLAIVAVFIGSVAIAGHSSVAMAESASYDWSQVAWSELSYRASKLGVSINSDVELSKITAREAASALVKPSEGTALVLEGPESVLMTLHTKGLGETSRLDLWLDPYEQNDLLDPSVSMTPEERATYYRLKGELFALLRTQSSPRTGGAGSGGSLNCGK